MGERMGGEGLIEDPEIAREVAYSEKEVREEEIPKLEAANKRALEIALQAGVEIDLPKVDVEAKARIEKVTTEREAEYRKAVESAKKLIKDALEKGRGEVSFETFDDKKKIRDIVSALELRLIAGYNEDGSPMRDDKGKIKLVEGMEYSSYEGRSGDLSDVELRYSPKADEDLSSDE